MTAAKPRRATAAAPSPRVMTVIAVLLTFASGASDVAAFTRLGNVFTSVMTGNMTMFGLSLARGSATLAAHTGVAVAGYVAGVGAGTLVGWYRTERRSARAAANQDGERWPPHMTLLLVTELVLLTGVLIGWELTGSLPSGTAQFVILAIAACAMGIQSAAVSQLGLGNVSTTYLTGTLTGLVGALFRPGAKVGWRRPGVLAGLVTGAVLAGVLLATASWAVPCLAPLAVTAATLVGVRSVNSR